MASKGHKNRQKRISYVGRAQLKKKEHVWVFNQKPGPHKKKISATIGSIIRDVLRFADNTKEIKYIVHNKTVLVNGRRVKDYHFGVGLFDILEFKEAGKKYRVYLTERNKILLKEMTKADKDFRPCKVISKTIVGKDKVQVTFDNGYNWILPKNKMVNVGDSVEYDVTTQNFTEILKRNEGSKVYIIGGPHVGKFGILKAQVKGDLTKASEVTVETPEGSFKTVEKYVFVVPRDFK